MREQSPNARALVVGLIALLVAIAGHWHIHLGYIDRINTASVPPDPPRRMVDLGLVHPAAATRVHIVLIDGLGYDHAMALPAFRALASEGVSRVLMADFPSFTDPNVRAMATGRPPLWSGVRINGLPPYPAWDTITRRAEDSGIVVRADGEDYPRIGGLFSLSEKTRFTRTRDLLAAPAPVRSLDIFYFGLVDDVGHEHGSASAEYHDAAVLADAFLARVVAGVDRATDAIFVMSDHGHMPEGGHGGAEPDVRRAVFVAAGRGVAKVGALPPASMRDVASTLAASLAIPAPKDAIGEPMLDVLADPEGKALAPPHDDAHAREQDLVMTDDFAAHARLRILIAGGVAAFAVALGMWWLGRASEIRLRARDALPALVHGLVFATLYAAMGYRISWSIKRSEIVFEVHTLLFGVLAALAAMKIGKLARRVEEAIVTTTLYGVAIVLEVAWIGIDTRFIAGPRASFFVFVLVTCHFYVGIASAFAVFRPFFSRLRFGVAMVGTACLVMAPIVYRMIK
ncbi:MAG: hypothetical protein JWM74_1007 [Myxococcaceae bacterium]|nr:hypothetical protein [Myxococcaceae bacterium]